MIQFLFSTGQVWSIHWVPPASVCSCHYLPDNVHLSSNIHQAVPLTLQQHRVCCDSMHEGWVGMPATLWFHFKPFQHHLAKNTQFLPENVIVPKDQRESTVRGIALVYKYSLFINMHLEVWLRQINTKLD